MKSNTAHTVTGVLDITMFYYEFYHTVFQVYFWLHINMG